METRETRPAAETGPVEMPLRNLPAALTPFVGREAALAEIAARLQDPACRLLTLVGLGGSGKTRLALEAARRIDGLAHGVAWVSLAPVQATEAVIPTIAQALGLSLQREGDPQQQVIAYLRQKSMLLILDNCEHLLAGVGVVGDILQATPGIKVLATSRARLRIQGEHLLPVGGMDYPALTPSLPLGTGPRGRGEVDDAAQYSAVKLFLSSARQAQAGFDPRGEDMAHVVRICRLVDGMPLGIILAAAWAEVLSPAEIAAEIERSMDFLAADWRDGRAEHRSMRAVFESTWKMLSEGEQRAFRGMSVFRGGFTRPAAEAVTGVALPELMSLVNKAMLQFTPVPSLPLRTGSSPVASPGGVSPGRLGTGGRYQVHELLRQFAEDKLRESPEEEQQVRDRHCACYATRSSQWEADLKGARRAEALADMRLEIDNVRTAWGWAVEQGQVQPLAQMANSLGQFYQEWALQREGEPTFRAAVERLWTAVSEPRSDIADELRLQGLWTLMLRTLARLLAWQGCFAFGLGLLEAADRSFDQGRSLLERPELGGQDLRVERALLLSFAGERMADADIQAGMQMWEQALALWRELGDGWGIGLELGNMAIAALLTSDYRAARRWWEELAAFRQSSGRADLDWPVYWGLSEVAAIQGDTATAVRWANALYGPYQAGDGRPTDAGACYVWGGVLSSLGEYAEAEAMWTQAVAAWTEQVPGLVYRPLMSLTETQLHLGRYEETRALAERVLAMTRQQHLPAWTAWALSVLGCVAIAKEEYPQARHSLEESIALFRQGRMFRHSLGRTLGNMGCVARMLGQPEYAWECLREALQIGEETGGLDPLTCALPGVALLLADRGERERAVELVALVWRHPSVSNSRWFQDVYGRHMAAVAAALPPEAVAAAQERGRARDLWATARELLRELG